MSQSKKNAVEKVPTRSAPLATTPSNAAKPSGYADFLLEVKTQIRQRQRQAALGWGKAVVENLARDVQTEFPGRNGFSARNLWNMLNFYRDYADKPKLQPLVAEIS